MSCSTRLCLSGKLTGLGCSDGIAPSYRYNVEQPYEKLKAFTRGQTVTQQSMRDFVAGIDGLPEHAKAELAQLTPATYTGNASAQARQLRQELVQL